MGTIGTVFNWLVILISALWAALCNVANSARLEVRRFILVEFAIFGSALVWMIIGFCLNADGLVILTGVISSIAWLVMWKSTDIAVSVIRSIGSKIPLIGTSVGATADEFHKLVSPLMTGATIFAFIGAIVAVRGTGYISWHTAIVILTGAWFVNLLTYYYNSKSKWAGGVMATIYGVLFLYAFVWPVQLGGMVDYFAGHSYNSSIRASKEGLEGFIVTIKPGTPLFEEKSGRFMPSTVKITKELRVKVLDRKPTMVSGEGVYRVALPANGYKDLFIGSKEVWVPARMVTPVNMADNDPKDAPPPAPAPAPTGIASTLPVKVYGEGIHTLPPLKKGEWTPFKIAFTEGHNSYAFTKGAKIKLHFDDNSIVDYGKGELATNKSNSCLRIEAYDNYVDEPLKMKVSNNT
jgi:hypothetical protein